jgi:hypothetical protein
MIGFIDDHRASHGVEPICGVLPITPSTYHAHAAQRVDPGKASARARRDAVLRARIQQVFEVQRLADGANKPLASQDLGAVALDVATTMLQA